MLADRLKTLVVAGVEVAVAADHDWITAARKVGTGLGD